VALILKEAVSYTPTASDSVINIHLVAEKWLHSYPLPLLPTIGLWRGHRLIADEIHGLMRNHLDFIKALSTNGFIQPFDWMNWWEGEQLVNNPALLKKASQQTLRKLLTAHVRADRFSEGHLAAMFEAGHIVMILKRLAEIHLR
jgi:hypothetical protein